VAARQQQPRATHPEPRTQNLPRRRASAGGGRGRRTLNPNTQAPCRRWLPPQAAAAAELGVSTVQQQNLPTSAPHACLYPRRGAPCPGRAVSQHQQRMQHSMQRQRQCPALALIAPAELWPGGRSPVRACT
jgi:hypothetical protein